MPAHKNISTKTQTRYSREMQIKREWHKILTLTNHELIISPPLCSHTAFFHGCIFILWQTFNSHFYSYGFGWVKRADYALYTHPGKQFSFPFDDHCGCSVYIMYPTILVKKIQFSMNSHNFDIWVTSLIWCHQRLDLVYMPNMGWSTTSKCVQYNWIRE